MNSYQAGAMVRQTREARGMGLRELARRVGVSSTFISIWERGLEISGPSQETTRRIAEVLELDPDELLRLSGRLPDDMRKWLVAEPDRVKKVRGMMERL